MAYARLARKDRSAIPATIDVSREEIGEAPARDFSAVSSSQFLVLRKGVLFRESLFEVLKNVE